ncbi:MAG: hypothetical protein EAX90_12755 [Candidatus Heimdallarchaeota archaeon]|nr:hypothetical protein [Candidatus Heimdallarchaeota archaeon]
MSEEKPIKVQDVKTYDQKLFLIINKREKSAILQDNNYRILIDSIRYKPRTVEEILEHYEDNSNPKSLMTVYRYLRKLIKEDLVVEAGKRILTFKDNRNKTLTLFSSSAKIFYDNTYDQLSDEISDVRKRECEVYSKMFEILTDGKESDMECINQIINSIYDNGLKSMTEIMAKYEKDLNKYLGDFGIMMTNTLIVHIGWMTAILNDDIRGKLLKCLK